MFFLKDPTICMDWIQERSTLGKSEVEWLIIASPWIPPIRQILDPPGSACSVLGAGSGQGTVSHGDTLVHGCSMA